MITVDDIAVLIRREMRGKLRASTVIDEQTKLDDLGMSSLQVSEVIFSLISLLSTSDGRRNALRKTASTTSTAKAPKKETAR